MSLKAAEKLNARKSRVNMILLPSDFETEISTLTKDKTRPDQSTENDKSRCLENINSENKEMFLSRLELKYANNSLSSEEFDACENVLGKSMNSVLHLLPNHHIDSTGLLRGFKFECHAEEKATVLPLGKDMFDVIAMYECRIPGSRIISTSGVLHPDAMRIFNNLEDSQAQIKEFMSSFEFTSARMGQSHEGNKTRAASFDCIRDEISSTKYTQQVPDKRTWRASKPKRLGLYHAYVRSHKKDAIEHKLFLVVSGCMDIACEELENIWQDVHSHVSCRDFIQSEECHWLRIATLRNHNRIALQVARMLNLKLETRLDMDDPSGKQYMAMPTTYTFKTDMYVTDNNRIQLVDLGCFLNRSQNGVLFEMFETEGYWLFTGPKDYASDCVYGIIAERSQYMNCFPTRTIMFNSNYSVKSYVNVVRCCAQKDNLKQIVFNPTAPNHDDDQTPSEKSTFFYFPDTEFIKHVELIGFDRNDSLLHLMPILSCESGYES